MMNPTNKVYINPNFNVPSRNTGTLNSKLHVNPNFSQMVQNKTKIYVNPNFVSSNVTHQNFNDSNLQLNSGYLQNNALSTASYTGVETNLSALQSSMYHKTTASTSKSRYSLVRHNTNKVLRSQENIITKNTVQINKYKSVAISKFKKNLDTQKTQQEMINKPSCSNISNGQKPILKVDKISPQYHHNMIKQSSTKIFRTSKFVYRKPSVDLSRTVLKLRAVKPPLKRNFKKNNIPCPLFKKYGKCLRSLNGKCDYLHDKKHVSICRKFIKGICHEKDCLLSHDITTKKMPTCYFYLQGICTRDNCPYLHVKLNDKTKVCPEFIKGYCEKGDKCLNRHTGAYKMDKNKLQTQTKRESLNSSASKNTKSKLKYVYTGKKGNKSSSNTLKARKEHTICDKEVASNVDNRYYKEVIPTPEDNNESTEVIKPTRCKLGTLPSFIKF